MADGLLTNILGAIDRQKQATKAGLGLLVSDPMEFARSATARYFPTPEEVAQQRALEQSGGMAMNTPYMDKMFNLAQFQGSIKPIGLLADVQQAASKTAPTQNLQALANEAYAALKANPNAVNKQKYVEARDRANAEFITLRDQSNPQQMVQEATDYKGQHTAPMNDSGKPLWDLSEIYPDDFYSSQGARFYGHGEDLGRDMRIVSQIQSFKGKPDRPVTIYRAVPKDVPKGQGINKGDWITTDRQYAKEHGQGALGNNYKIIKKTVKARDIFTNGDSIYEFGYDPQPFIPKSQRSK